MTTKKIGFFGLGNMGGRICNAIVKHGYDVTVYDINPPRMAPYTGRAALGKSPVDVFDHSDIIMLSLPSSKEVESTIELLLEHGADGKMVVDLSTSYPPSTRKLYERLKQHGAKLVDIPVSGLPADADDGHLLALYGGDKEDQEPLRQIVSCFADRFPYMGTTGCGHVAKLIFNFIGLSYVSIYALAFPLTEKLGLDNHQLYDLLCTTGMGCGTMEFYVPKMIDKTYDMAFAMELAHKDLSYCKNMFEEFQVPAYALDGTLDMLRTAIRDGKGKDDYSVCISTMFDFFKSK